MIADGTIKAVFVPPFLAAFNGHMLHVCCHIFATRNTFHKKRFLKKRVMNKSKWMNLHQRSKCDEICLVFDQIVEVSKFHSIVKEYSSILLIWIHLKLIWMIYVVSFLIPFSLSETYLTISTISFLVFDDTCFGPNLLVTLTTTNTMPMINEFSQHNRCVFFIHFFFTFHTNSVSCFSIFPKVKLN